MLAFFSLNSFDFQKEPILYANLFTHVDSLFALNNIYMVCLTIRRKQNVELVLVIIMEHMRGAYY